MTEPAVSILVVDDEFSVRDSMTHWFQMDGHEVTAAADGVEALRAMESGRFDVVFADIKMPGMDGVELQRRIHQADPSIAVIMITAFASVETAVQALKQGAFDYVTKPVDPDELSHLVRRAVEQRRLRNENTLLRQTIDDMAGIDTLVGTSPAMREVLEQIQHVAATDAKVLIRGETGTGKELIARAIHANSARRYFPIVPVNCGSIPAALLESELFGHEKGAFTGALYRRKGKLEMADRGTLFLDEVGAIEAPMQVDLLRVLESQEFTRLGGSTPVRVDSRLICATNEDLERYVAEGRFREDLYYRINVFTIVAPPLRERRSDIPALARYFLRRLSTRMDRHFDQISADAIDTLCGHDWPGNVRELANVIERAMVMATPPALTARDLSLARDRPPEAPSGCSLEEVERRHVARTLEETAWNISQTARLLGIDRTTLYAKIKKYDLRR